MIINKFCESVFVCFYLLVQQMMGKISWLKEAAVDVKVGGFISEFDYD